MKQIVLSNFDMPWIPLTGLLLFVICFTLFVYWTYQKRNKEAYVEASLLPIEDLTSKTNMPQGATHVR